MKAFSQFSKKQKNKDDSKMISPNQMQIHTPALIQAKLTVGSVDDPMEHEADAVADQVIRMPDNAHIQRKCTDCEEKDKKAHRKPIVSFIQKKNDAARMEVNEKTNDQIQSSKGAGSPMLGSVRSFMESRFGTDFSNVKIHTDNNAIQLNRELNAQAFTVGNDVFFNEGKYAPESEPGKHLLAHELVHTIQQGSALTSVQKQGDDDPAHGWETDAESFAKRAAEHYLSTERKVVDTVQKVEVRSGIDPSSKECLVTTAKGILVKVLWSTDTNKVIVKACVRDDCLACGYDYSVNNKGDLDFSRIRCWLIAEI